MRQLLRWPVIAAAIGIILSMLVVPAASGFRRARTVHDPLDRRQRRLGDGRQLA